MQLLDYTIVGTFLVFTLLLGLQKGWRAWDIADYAIGGRNYSTISLTLTLFATMMGSGVTMGMVELACKMGLVIVFINSAYAISRFLIARYFADAFAGFPQALSIASVVGTVYGRGARILTAVLGILSISSLISLQFRGMGTWAQHLLGLNYGQGLILGAIFITFYSSFGGIKGVTYTDILQGILIIVGFPVICFFAVQSVGGLGPLFERTPIEKINPVLHPKFWNEYFPLFILSLIPKFSPQNVHRLLMAKDARQAKHSFYAMSIMEIVFYMMFGILGLVVCLRSPNIPAKQAFCAIVTDLLPIGLRGLAVVAVLSVIMSTADSMINTTGVLFAHDIVNPLMEGRLNGRQQKVLASWASIGTGILGILFAWKINDIMAMKWLRKALWVPCLMVPIFCLLCGYRTSKKRFYAAAIAGLSGYALWEFFVKPYANTNGILPSMIVNALVLLDVPAILKRRKVKQQFEDRIKGGELVEVGQKASFFQRLARQCEYRTQIFGAPYLAFGLFMALVYVIPIFMWSPSCCHFRTAIMLHIISLVVIAFLVLKPYWPKELKPYWSLCWYGTLMFSLPTIATFYLLDTSDIVHSGFDFILSS
ncbi:MAG: sodium:solute symporter family protein, partial [Puniceicoccales bacterium]|nr:sodium:solute symporter family protein [Puniceicoccales bacterium]